MTKRKLYQDLSIDEPLPHDPALEAEVSSASPEQLKAMFEEGWFANPGGHFRRRILRQVENAGFLRIVTMPEGHEQIQMVNWDHPKVLPEQRECLISLFDLLTAVDGELDEPYDAGRTRTDYDPELRKLKSAKPYLIYRVENAELTERGLEFKCALDILCGVERDIAAELISEGFDKSGKTGLGAVYYCHIARAGEQFVMGTFMAPRALVQKAWGDTGAACCDPVTGFAPARIEAKLTSREHLDNPDVVLVRAEMAFLKTYGERH